MRGKLYALQVVKTRLGRAVVARRRFVVGQIVGEFRGRIIADPNFNSEYCVELDDRRSLEPYPPLRFLNHSCEPNCEIVYEDDETKYPAMEDRLWLQTIAPIVPGDELTIDYAWPADSAIPCGCQTKSCRGWIVDPAELPLVQEKAAQISPHGETSA